MPTPHLAAMVTEVTDSGAVTLLLAAWLLATIWACSWRVKRQRGKERVRECGGLDGEWERERMGGGRRDRQTRLRAEESWRGVCVWGRGSRRWGQGRGREERVCVTPAI